MQPPVPDHHPERTRDVIRRGDRCLVLKNQVDCSKPKVVNVWIMSLHLLQIDFIYNLYYVILPLYNKVLWPWGVAVGEMGGNFNKYITMPASFVLPMTWLDTHCIATTKLQSYARWRRSYTINQSLYIINFASSGDIATRRHLNTTPTISNEEPRLYPSENLGATARLGNFV